MSKRILIILTVFAIAFIEQGMADINVDLNKAAASGDLEKVKLLIKEGAEIDSKADDEREIYATPLWQAVFKKHIEIAGFLIEVGADLERKTELGGDDAGTTAVIYAANLDSAKSETATRMLIEAGANPNSHNRKGWTALHKVSQQGKFEVAKLLIDSGADAKAVDKLARSALSLAKKRPRNDDVIQLLIDAGA